MPPNVDLPLKYENLFFKMPNFNSCVCDALLLTSEERSAARFKTSPIV